MKNILPYITGVTAVLLWGAWFPITRYSVISSLGATDTIFLRFTVGSLIAIPLLFRFGFKIQQKYSFWARVWVMWLPYKTANNLHAKINYEIKN